MKQQRRKSIPERLGKLAEKARIWCVDRERGLTARLSKMGVPLLLSKTVLWGVKLALAAVMLYAAFWIAIVLIGLALFVWLARNVDGTEEPQWGVKTSEDHRESIFYHPASHNDDPDPRFEDD
jgi:Flp pilus assembly protein TadB